MILPADKGKCSTILDGKDQDIVYEVLQKDQTLTYKNKLINIIRPWRRETGLSDRLEPRIYPTSEDTLEFYGIPKIPKKNALSIQYFKAPGESHARLSKFLTSVLHPLGMQRHTCHPEKPGFREDVVIGTDTSHTISGGYEVSALYSGRQRYPDHPMDGRYQFCQQVLTRHPTINPLATIVVSK